MTYHIQLQTVTETEGGVFEALSTFTAQNLRYAFERAQEQIAIDFGNVEPYAITLVIGKAPVHGPA